MKKIIVSIGMLTCFLSSFGQQKQEAEENFEKFKQYYSLLYSYYMDTIDYDKLITTAISKSLENLDPHSVYIEPKEAKSETERLNGSFEGIGISYNVIRDTLQIVTIIPNGPSEKVGLFAGDKILSINDTVFAGFKHSNEDYVSRLKGPKGTKVKIIVMRQGKIIPFTIVRDVIPLQSVDAAFMIKPEIGYIRLNKYSQTTPIELDSAMIKLNKLGMKSLIIDLQNNGGGLMNAAISLSDQFTDEDLLIVYTQGLHSPKQEYRSSKGGLFTKGKLILLVNQFSASASEITAGAVQDWDRGLIIGRRTYGKGLVQRPFTLQDNSQVRLTTARYYTPSGRSIQKPYDEDVKEYQSELLHRYQSGMLTGADTFKVPDSLMKYTLHGRKVYGGGGITPDIYVPLDTTMNTEYYFKLMRAGVINTFCFDYANAHKKELMTKYPNEDYYVANFEVDQTIINELAKAGVAADIPREDTSIVKSLNLFKTILKANIGRDLYSSTAFYKVIVDIDPIVQKSLEVMHEDFKKYKVENQ